jgi:hypothetical protein
MFVISHPIFGVNAFRFSLYRTISYLACGQQRPVRVYKDPDTNGLRKIREALYGYGQERVNDQKFKNS